LSMAAGAAEAVASSNAALNAFCHIWDGVREALCSQRKYKICLKIGRLESGETRRYL
jgi:hypothetical protein